MAQISELVEYVDDLLEANDNMLMACRADVQTLYYMLGVKHGLTIIRRRLLGL